MEKELLQRPKRAKEENRDVWISYDTLYIDGVAVRNIPSGYDGDELRILSWTCQGLLQSKTENVDFGKYSC